MRILLISPMIKQAKTDPPLGLCYLQACLDKAGYTDSKIVDIYKSYDEIKRIIAEYNPDVVGISCFTVYRGSSYKLARLAKEVNPGVKVVMGGPHATYMWEQIMRNLPFVDMIVLGEGDVTIVELVRALDKNLPLDDVKGIVFRKGSDVVKTDARPLIDNLDEVPFPSYRDINLDYYAVAKPPEYYSKQKKASIVSSRGCVFSCNFCSTTVFWSRRWRPRSPANVVDEMEKLYKEQSVKFFTFVDDIFTTNPQRVIEICKEIMRRNMKIKWYAETRVDCIPKEMLEWMKKAGCFLIQLGVESGSDTILKNINKKITGEQVVNAIKTIRDVGMRAETLLMVGNPGETKETVDETRKVLLAGRPDEIVVSVTRVFPSTQLCELAKKQGLLSDDFWLSDKIAPEYTVENSMEDLLIMRLNLLKGFYDSKGRFAYLGFILNQFMLNPRILTDHLKVFLLGSKTLVE